MQQRSFGSVEYEHKKVKTRRQAFLKVTSIELPQRPRTGHVRRFDALAAQHTFRAQARKRAPATRFAATADPASHRRHRRHACGAAAGYW